ncbi:MAG: peptide chain release factor 1 [Bacilli bacterium]|nr:peptide chain release factor 1 [Bacilli bacterium]CCY08103.1 peptide chain release factor 1 [Coprobacillus sp. CAG:698]
MLDRLKLIESKYQEINEKLSDPEVVKDVKKYTALMKERRDKEKIVEVYHEYKNVLNQIEDLKILVKDENEEIKELAEMDLEEANKNKVELEEKLKIMLIPKDPNDDKNVVCEIRGAAGGDEANIFAGDLFRMYSRYAESKNWKIEITNALVSDMGGYSQIEFMIKGEGAYSFLKYESGSHRVQRVPETEAQGRIQTSTATVLIMPEPDEVDAEMNMDDVRIDIFCASGPGGQCVNTTKSAIRVTHIPTGIVVSCQDGKNQHENKANALKVLQARLYDLKMQEKAEKEGQERLAKIGRGSRSEKIRTYNYPQNRVTDHRIGFTVQQLDRIMEGRLDVIIDALIAEDQKRKLQTEEN